MIWKKCILQARVETGQDALGNPVYVWNDVEKTAARLTPWTDEQITLEGRDVTRNEQRLVIPIPFEQFPVCQKAVIDGVSQEITQVIDLSPRYTMIQIKIYKGDAYGRKSYSE